MQQNVKAASVANGQPLRFELVEIPIDNASQSLFNFPVDQNLQGKRVLYVDVYNVETASVSPTGRAVISVAVFLRSTLTLYSTPMSRENLQRMPFTCLNVLDVPAGSTPYAKERILLNNIGTDWTKCQVNTGTAIGVTGVSMLFGVWYVDN